ncbi:MAG: hypothetical protein AB7L90_21185 [Hyphomicrobiaceae bacterium]
MSKLKTDESLLTALRTAAMGNPTAKEVQEQRISFIMGSLDRKSGVTRERVMKVLADQQGK